MSWDATTRKITGTRIVEGKDSTRQPIGLKLGPYKYELSPASPAPGCIDTLNTDILFLGCNSNTTNCSIVFS